MSHTPGPWKVDKNYKGFVNIRRDVDSYTPDIATVWDFYAKNYRSNARLIAAAPDMLRTLESVLALINESFGVVGYHLNGEVATWEELGIREEVEAAIRKARGEG